MTAVETPRDSLIRTKVHGPVPRTLVPRLDVTERLVHAPARKLTVIRGQAGWGKSSLLAAWSAADPRPFGWLGLDHGDNDPVRFFSYTIAALQTLTESIGNRSASVLRAPGVDIIDDVLPLLINELDALPDHSVLVLEDYHAINNIQVHHAVAYFLDHAPASLELVVSTRVEPPLPLSRLRGRGELLEVTASDLRFSVTDARTLLVDQQGLAVDQADLTRLVERTEGWPAGLYLAALSLRGRDDAHEFIDTFAGDDRNVVDYLTTEVLANQPPPLRAFMLTTSILERLSAALCDEVVEATGAAATLKTIEESNSFLIALDNRREWYRYHHLFRELLHNELLNTDAAAAAGAHRRAAAWLRGRGAVSEAIGHLVAAGDLDDAGELIASSWLSFATSGGDNTVQAWLALLPATAHERDSRLCVAGAVTAISTGRLDDVGPWIERAAQAPARGPFYDGFSSGTAAAACLRAVHAWLLGDLGACRTAAQAAIARADQPSPWDSVTYTWLGASQFWLGQRKEGMAALQQGLKLSEAADFFPPWIACLGMLGLIHHLNGNPDAARALAEQALTLSTKAGLDEYWITTAAHITRAGLLSDDGQVDQARQELERAVEVAHRGSGPVEVAHAQLALSAAATATGDLEAARRYLDQARSVVSTCPDPGPVLTALLHRSPSGPPAARRAPAMLAPRASDFSERETAVLRLLATTLTQREIGDTLFISFNTVKTHSKSIFRKLDVATRADAVSRARELHLIH